MGGGEEERDAGGSTAGGRNGSGRPGQGGPGGRAERLRAALRANLARRKRQARALGADAIPADPGEEEEPCRSTM